MRIGKLFIGWREIPGWEAVEFGLSAHSLWRGFFIEWGDPDSGCGVLLMTDERA